MCTVVEVLRGWRLAYWDAIRNSFRCMFGAHAWRVFGDWRDGAIFTHGGKRYWGFTHNDDLDFAGRVKIECDRCRVRDYGHFEKPTGKGDWLNHVESLREWRLVDPRGHSVAGGPTHEEAEQELR